MSRFKVGDVALAVRVGSMQVVRPCRACNGDRAVTLILGSGEQVRLECGACSKGYHEPTGTETDYEFQAKLTPYQITGIEVVETANGQNVTYRSGTEHGYYTFGEGDLFVSEEEAQAECARKVAEHEAEEERRIGEKVKYTNKNYAWNAAYHLREAKRHEKDAAYHNRKAVILKAKSKTPVEQES